MAKKKSKARKALDPSLPIYQIKISLQYTSPPIWRRVRTNDCSLDELHDIIQVCMGWSDEHMYAFVIEREEYRNGEMGGDFAYDSRSVRLSQVVKEGHIRFRYDYDFGDDWKHEIVVERTLLVEKGVSYPRCVKGARACPPEDCGGPHGYPYFLDKIQDPEHEEHEDALEWIGGEFDPEAFDLEEVNRRLRYLRRWLGKQKGKHAFQAAFARGGLVRVKPGVFHDLYDDIPLGGWVARVARITWLTPVGYAVHWTKPTLDQAHAVYLKRCRRDNISPKEYWLEEDQLEEATDETPEGMEQPTKIVTRPLSMDLPEDSIRMVFGLTSDDGLPEADDQSQRTFFEYLKTHLSFPFKAEHWAASDVNLDKAGTVRVLGFWDPPLDRKEGIVCKARQEKQEFLVRLADLEVEMDDPNSPYVGDYSDWLSEAEVYDEDEEYGEEEGDAEAWSQFPIGSVAYYGPDDKTTTKVVAGVFNERGAEPILKRWVATDVITNPKVQGEITQFFKSHDVVRIGMSDGNMGCPHEEGEDFPAGGDCPFCPWWKGKQGSGAER